MKKLVESSNFSIFYGEAGITHSKYIKLVENSSIFGLYIDVERLDEVIALMSETKQLKLG